MQDGKLSLEEYPSVLPMPEECVPKHGKNRLAGSVRQNTVTKFRSSRISTNDLNKRGKIFGSRQIIFIVGGACYSELRCGQELMEMGGSEILIGSTTFITPHDFLEDLSTL